MKIGVDAGSLSIADDRLKVGIYRIVSNLLLNLSHRDKGNHYFLYSFGSVNQTIMRSLPRNFANIVLSPSFGYLSLRLPMELLINRVDVFLALSQAVPNIPFASTTKIVGFVYDVGFAYNSEAYGESYSRIKGQTDFLVRRSDTIVTISKASKKDILANYSVPEDKIIVCYPGVEGFFSPRGIKYRRKRPYILFVGSLNKAKDLSLAIRAFRLFSDAAKKCYDFLLVGGDYWPDNKIQETIDNERLRSFIQFEGFVSDTRLAEYYRGAAALLTTSIREGFCLPAAEAMACGTPVVAVDRGSLPEVLHGCGLITQPIPGKIAEALMLVTSNQSIRKKLSQKGIKRAQKFRWSSFSHTINAINSRYEHT